MAAPKGNHNALKHGFYSRAFRQVDLNDLESIEEGLKSEIAMMRVATRRVFEVFNAYHQSAAAGAEAAVDPGRGETPRRDVTPLRDETPLQDETPRRGKTHRRGGAAQRDETPASVSESHMLADLSDALNSLGLANVRVANLLKTNFILTGGGGGMLELLWEELIYSQKQKGLIP